MLERATRGGAPALIVLRSIGPTPVPMLTLSLVASRPRRRRQPGSRRPEARRFRRNRANAAPLPAPIKRRRRHSPMSVANCSKTGQIGSQQPAQFAPMFPIIARIVFSICPIPCHRVTPAALPPHGDRLELNAAIKVLFLALKALRGRWFAAFGARALGREHPHRVRLACADSNRHRMNI